jgi:alcohol dehydrogenase class IV
MRASDIISAVKARQDEIARALAVGNATNWEAYQRLVGEVAGLQRTLDIINNLLEKEEDD